LEDLGVDGRKLIFERCVENMLNEIILLVIGSCGYDNELHGFIKSREVLNKLSDCWLLYTDSARWIWLWVQ
jgi:hypothetical protein